MTVKYKLKCIRCKKNYVTATWKDRYVICYECQKKDLQGEIKDPKLKKLLDIPEEFYRKNSFLRNIKINCIRYGRLTEKQIQAFENAIQKIKKQKKLKNSV